MTQRLPGFNGGIQPGTSATGTESSGTEKLLRQAAARITAGSLELSWVPGLSAATLAERLGLNASAADLAGVYPDGGIWLLKDGNEILVAAEAKRQGPAGNAIERWFKNYSVLKALGVRVFVTLCTGDGFFDGNSAQRTLQLAVAMEESDRSRLTRGDVWNKQEGSLWMYRFRTASEAEAFDVVELLQAALAHAVAIGPAASN
jgi:hypothetical protein